MGNVPQQTVKITRGYLDWPWRNEVFSRLFHQVWILLCRHLIRRSQQFKFRAPTQKLLVQFVHMYNCHLLSWISSLHTNTFLRHLDLISPNLRIFRCEITLTRALDFMRLGFRFIAPFGRKLIEAQMGQKWWKCQAPNYGNYQVIFEFTMLCFLGFPTLTGLH